MADELNIDQSDDEDSDQINQYIYVLNSRVSVCEVCAYVSLIKAGTTSLFSFHKCIILFPGKRGY